MLPRTTSLGWTDGGCEGGTGARAARSGVLGTVAGIAHLASRLSSWRAGWSGALAAGTLAVELVGVLAAALLVWALWHGDATVAPPDLGAAPDGPTAVMVVSAARELPWLRATVLAARDLGPITIVDVVGREDVRTFAAEHGLGLLVTEPDDLNGFDAFVTSCTTATFVHLCAGDIPHPALVARALPHLRDPRTAIVQAVSAEAAGGAGTDPRRAAQRHRDADRRALNRVWALAASPCTPGPGRSCAPRRCATSALVARRRRWPRRGRPPACSLRGAGSSWPAGSRSSRPIRCCWPRTSSATRRARPAPRTSCCSETSVRCGRSAGASLHQRLAMLAWSVRPLAGVRRSVLVALVAAALLAGGEPLDVSPAPLLALWAPWLVLSAAGVHALSGGWIRPGDRSRAAFRSLGTSWRGVTTPNGRPEAPRRIVGGAFGLHHSVGPTVAVVLLGVVLGLRGSSDRFTHTLRPVDGVEMAALLGVALWLLWSALDALLVLARRIQSRRARRIAASLPCTMLDHAALIIDLTPSGAGVLSDVEAGPGDRLRIDVVLPTSDGVTSARIPAVVRNVRLDVTGEHRIGVQFGDLDRFVAEALAEHCLVQPGLEALGTAPEIDRSEIRPVLVLDADAGGPRRLGLRVAALVALAGAFASAIPSPPPAAAQSSTSRGRVELAGGEPVAGAVARAVCATDAGVDARYGTADDRFTSPTTAVSGRDGAYELARGAGACWVSVAVPRG